MMPIRYFCWYSWLFPPNVKHSVWSDEQGAFTYPCLVPDQILSDRGPCTWTGPALVHTWVRTKFLVPKGTVYITKFGPDRGPIRIWFGPNWFCKRCKYCEVSIHLGNCNPKTVAVTLDVTLWFSNFSTNWFIGYNTMCIGACVTATIWLVL